MTNKLMHNTAYQSHTHCSQQLSVRTPLEILGHPVKTVQLTSHTTSAIQIVRLTSTITMSLIT